MRGDHGQNTLHEFRWVSSFQARGSGADKHKVHSRVEGEGADIHHLGTQPGDMGYSLGDGGQWQILGGSKGVPLWHQVIDLSIVY